MEFRLIGGAGAGTGISVPESGPEKTSGLRAGKMSSEIESVEFSVEQKCHKVAACLFRTQLF